MSLIRVKYFIKSLKKIALFIFSILFIISCGSKEVRKSKEFIQAGMYSEAVDLLNIEIQQNPKNAEAQYLLGYVHLLIDQENRSDEFFHRAELLDKNYLQKRPKAYFDAARQLLPQKISLSIYYFDKSIEKKHDFKNDAAKICYDHAKEILNNGEKFYDGLGLLKKAIQFNPTLLSSVSSYCIKIANKEFESGNLERSFSLLELAIDPLSTSEKNSLLIKIGFKQWKDGNRSFSKKCLQEAIENGANFENNDSLFYAFHIDFESSSINDNTFLKFLNLFPESSFYPEILYKRAELYFIETNLSKSKEIFTELINKYQNNDFARLAKKRLDIWPYSSVIDTVFIGRLRVNWKIDIGDIINFKNNSNDGVDMSKGYYFGSKQGFTFIPATSVVSPIYFDSVKKIRLIAKVKKDKHNQFEFYISNP